MLKLQLKSNLAVNSYFVNCSLWNSGKSKFIIIVLTGSQNLLTHRDPPVITVPSCNSSFNFKHFTFCQQSIIFLVITPKTDIISLYNIRWMILLLRLLCNTKNNLWFFPHIIRGHKCVRLSVWNPEWGKSHWRYRDRLVIILKWILEN
jgi:hypothetical protein